MIDLNKIEAAAKASVSFSWREVGGFIVSREQLLEMVSMIRERDAVLRQALLALTEHSAPHLRHEEDVAQAIAAIKGVLG